VRLLSCGYLPFIVLDTEICFAGFLVNPFKNCSNLHLALDLYGFFSRSPAENTTVSIYSTVNYI